MTLNKKETYLFTRKLYKALKSNKTNQIVLEKIRGSNGCEVHGLYIFEKDQIKLDYRQPIIPTLIHEYLHKWNPKKSETWVLAKEKEIVNSLSKRQIKNILKRFSEAIK